MIDEGWFGKKKENLPELPKDKKHLKGPHAKLAQMDLAHAHELDPKTPKLNKFGDPRKKRRTADEIWRDADQANWDQKTKDNYKNMFPNTKLFEEEEEEEQLNMDFDLEDLDRDEDYDSFSDLINFGEEPLEELANYSLQTRIRMGRRMMRRGPRNALLRHTRADRYAPTSRLNMRAHRAAIMQLRQRIAGTIGAKYRHLPRQQKINIDAQVKERYGNTLNSYVKRLSSRFIPIIRAKEQRRVSAARRAHYMSVKEGKHHKHHGARSGKLDDRLHVPLRDYIGKGISDADLDLDLSMMGKNGIGRDQLDQTAQGALTKKWRRDIDEARTSARDAEGGGDTGDSGIINQLRKIVRLRSGKVTFANGKSMEVHPEHARHALRWYAERMSKNGPGHYGIDKQKDVLRLGHSPNHFFDMIGLKESVSPVKVVKIPKKLQDDRDDKNPQSYLNAGSRIGNGASPAAMFPTNEAADPQAIMTKMDTLLRSGMVDPKKIQKYRAALRAGSKASMNPDMRNRLLELLGKFVEMTTKDPQMYNRARSDVAKMNEEFESLFELLNANQINQQPKPVLPPQVQQRSLAQQTVGAREGDGHHVVAGVKKMPKGLGINALMKKLDQKILGTVNAKLRPARTVSEDVRSGLEKKAERSGIDYDILEEVFFRGLDESGDDSERAFNRVNSFIQGGFARELDEDLEEAMQAAPVYVNKYIYVRNHRTGKLQRRRVHTRVRGFDETAAEYAAQTPGQTGIPTEPNSRYDAGLPWVDQDKEDTGSSPKTFADVRNALAGKREISEEASELDQAFEELK